MMSVRSDAKTLGATLLTLPLLALCACGPETSGPSAQEPQTVLGMVEASNYPLAYFAERLAGPSVEVRLRTAAAADPAYWRPPPEAIAEMQRADLILLNGASYEHWLKNVALPPSRLVDTTAGQQQLLLPLTDTVTHSHGPEGAHEHSGTAFTTWLDLRLASAQASSVADALSRRWPEQRELFAQRLAQLKSELGELDAELADTVARAPETAVLFSHPVYQYLQRRYGIAAESLHWEPDSVPDESAWQQLEELLQRRPAAWMIWEAEPLPEVAARLEQLGIGSVVFAPCATPPATGDFIDAMRANLERLQRVYD